MWVTPFSQSLGAGYTRDAGYIWELTLPLFAYVKMAIRRLSSSTLAMSRYAAVRNGTRELNSGQMSPFSLNRVPFILGAIVHSEDDPGKQDKSIV